MHALPKHRLTPAVCLAGAAVALSCGATAQAPSGTLRGRVVDAHSGRALACRVYCRSADGEWRFVEADGGRAVRYDKQNWVNPRAVERHVSLEDGRFRASLPPGRYSLTVERGKEYRPLIREIEVGASPQDLALRLERWIDMAALGWYSGDVHVHRPLDELPVLQAAEDLNVAYPLTYWVTQAFEPPARGDKNTDAGSGEGPVRIDGTHVAWPRSTEWEIFTIRGQRHTLGALFALGHRGALAVGTPPIRQAAEEARRAGALLDLDKHDWPWAIALVHLADVDLYELSNNHVWRTEFGFTTWNAQAPAYMGLPNEGKSGGERDWLEYTHRNYWTFLNCGYRLRPSAGTASGVHPVPPGFGRVYVRCPEGFTYERWRSGLDAGRSFVTTGPMPLVEFDGRTPGHGVRLAPGEHRRVRVSGRILSEQALESIELIVNGVPRRIEGRSRRGPAGSVETTVDETIQVDGTTWMAARCWEVREGGRVRFAHTAPTWYDAPDRPLRPRRDEVEFLVRRVQEQLDRSAAVLPGPAISEYRRARAAYARLLDHAR